MSITPFSVLKNGAFALVLTAGISVAPVKAQAEPILSEIKSFGSNFCPRGWAATSGQLLAISSNTALFSLLGTIYGGDGRTTFALPDLRGRAIVAPGAGPGLSSVQVGQRFGNENTTLSVLNMPSHNHMVNANNGAVSFADRRGPANDFLGSPSYNDPANPAEDISIYSDQAPNVQMDSRMISNEGGGQQFSNSPPRLAVQTCIALQGIYPSRN